MIPFLKTDLLAHFHAVLVGFKLVIEWLEVPQEQGWARKATGMGWGYSGVGRSYLLSEGC